MGKVITAKRKEGEAEQAQNYIKTHILFPSGLLGLLAMVIGVFALIYQLIVDTYDVFTFAQSSGLLIVGIVLGLIQTMYHKFILREHPEFFASRMKRMGQSNAQRKKKPSSEVMLTHRGRKLVPVWYIIGLVSIIGLSAWSFSSGALDYMAAFAWPWAGFFWGKMFSWRGVIDPPSRSKKKNL
ncbi:MAG: hypothetical protein GKS05_07140 [Nitrospirales bacterium]|nr:hypothetical protein [Nitrospirales bacterium]